jgi:hypothetical protein
MGRRSRKRDASPPLAAPEEVYADPEHGELVLRAVLSPKTRTAYARLAEEARPGAAREDLHHRRAEFLFERLAARWTVGGVPTEGDKALLQRWRAASREERAFVLDALRRHCAEWFPDVAAP